MQSSTLSKSSYGFRAPISLLVAILYGWILASLDNDYFKDRVNYVVYAENFDSIIKRYDGLSFFFNEPLFLLYNKFLSGLLSPDFVPKLGVFFISSSIAFFIIRYSKNWLSATIGFALLFFVFYTFHLQLVVLRQGIATALLMWALHFFGLTWRFYFCAFLLSFFHISFALVFIFLVFEKLVAKIVKSVRFRVFLVILGMLVVSVFLLQVASFFGVRQAESGGLASNSNGFGGFLLFLFILVFFYLRGLNNVFQNPFGRVFFIGVLVYLVFYYSIPISGRIIGTFLPFFYVYFVSEFQRKMLFASTVFLFVNFFIFWGAIKGGSLTEEGVRFFGGII